MREVAVSSCPLLSQGSVLAWISFITTDAEEKEDNNLRLTGTLQSTWVLPVEDEEHAKYSRDTEELYAGTLSPKGH
jgi:hypothetical protein